VAVRIGSNIGSLQAQRRLSDATSAVSSSLARLSSGQRINRASDDAAGIAIADTLKARSRVYSRGAQNVNDGISLLNIAEGSLGELSGITTRILELAEQAATGGYSLTQRRALDTEAQRLREEFFRIARSTQFNGLNLFDGSIQGLRIQSGYGVDGGITSSLGGKLGTGELVDSSAATSTGASAFSLATADFNGDGVIDVVTSNASGTRLKYLRGNGDGTFATPIDLVVGGTTVDLAAADFNNDGAMDIIAASGTTTLSLFLNNRAGGFNTVSNITTSGNANQIIATDTNADGRMDIVVSNNNAGTDTVSVLLGSGTGTFSSATDISLGAGVDPYFMQQGDFNGDGTTDLAVANGSTGNIQTLLGNGAGGFGAATVGLSSPYFLQFTIGDFNGDGKDDLAGIPDGGGNIVSVYLRSSNGTSFGAFGSFIFSSTTADLTSISSGDMNGDGALDIVATDSDALAFTLLGDGFGNFTERFVYTVDFVSAETATVDVNGDGTLDIVGTNGAIKALLNTAQSGVNPIVPFSLKNQAEAAQAIAPLTRKLEELNKQRGVIGGFVSRLTTAGQSATSQSDGFRAAESRIRDVDVAQEVAKLTGAQIRQQAATAVLAQANLQPSLALQLLRL
jgi:flagellin-like hook-associated protein FlgL